MEIDPWGNVGRVALGPAGAVSIVDGSSFVISGPDGDVLPGGVHGLFHSDTRFLSTMQVVVDGETPEPLAGRVVDPYSARFVLRVPWKGEWESPLVLVRSRFVGDGLHEDLDLTNHGLESVELGLVLRVDADFADLFEVKGLGAAGRLEVRRRPDPGDRLLRLESATSHETRATEIRVTEEPEAVSEAELRFRVRLEPGESWHTCIDVAVESGSERSDPRFQCEAFESEVSPIARRAEDWRGRLPRVHSGSDALNHLYEQSGDDLAALLMESPDGSGDLTVAAGLPWFMTLFGRDAIFTAMMALPFDRELATGVLRTLARFQGTRFDETSEEQPGKILHEIRLGDVAAESGRSVYYGTVDATPLFVMLAAEAWRWGLDWGQVESLLPNVRAALEWMRTDGDPDADGYLEYPGEVARGLRNQGWKDSGDAVQFADGRLAEGPIALSEVQGAKYRALLDAAALLEQGGDASDAERARAEAADLAERFRRDFWVEEIGFPALALDGEKRRVDAVASNAGRLLWTGILEPEQAVMVARRLVSQEFFTGWGLRTLSTSNRGYKPVSYHVGSVWPHDTALAAAGLARAGYGAEALRIAHGLIEAAPHFSYRLPELFSGFSREEVGFPVGYPTTSSPQAWAAGSVLLLLRVLLGLEADVPGGRLEISPILPPESLPLELEGMRVGDGRVSLRVGPDGTVQIMEAPSTLRVDVRPSA